MRELSNLELHVLTHELQQLVGARLQKFYELGNGDFRLEFFLPGKGTQDFTIQLKARLGFTKFIRPAPSEPSHFAMQVRKRLEGAVVKKLEQYGMDRVMFIDFEREQKPLRLIIEMFSDGNLLVTDADGKIIIAYREEDWKDRKLRRGAQYIFPASTKVNPFDLSAEKLKDVMNEKKLIACLAGRIDLGATYLEEVLHRAKLPFDKRADTLNDDEIGALMEALIEVVQQINRHEPVVYYRNGTPSDFSPFPLEKFSGLEMKTFKTMSEMLDEFYGGAAVETGEPKMESKLEEEQRKLKFTLQSQKAAITELKKKSEEAKLAGDRIYEKYPEVEAVLKLVLTMKKGGASWDEIEQALKHQLPEAAKLVQKIDRVKGKVTFEL